MMVAIQELLDNAQSLSERDPIFGQILILYEKHRHGEQDDKLANFVLTQIYDAMQKNDAIDKFYEDEILKHHGVTRKIYERETDKLFAAMDREEFSGSAEDFLEDHEEDDFSHLSSELMYEMDFVDSSTYDLLRELTTAIGSTDFNKKLRALDTVMHNFHAGIAPGQILGVTRDEIEDFAEFLKHASGTQLAFLTRQMETPEEREVARPAFGLSPIEGHMPSGRPIRFGDRRPKPSQLRSVLVRRHRRHH